MQASTTTSSQRKALIIGGTGLVGGQLLRFISANPAYSHLATLGRKAPQQTTGSPVPHWFFDQTERCFKQTFDVVFCSLGTTIKKAGSETAFRKVDLELVVQLAKVARDNVVKTFIVVSSLGANPTSANFYLATKGQMEKAVEQLSFPCYGIVRPSLLLGKRSEVRPAERLGQLASKIANPLLVGGLQRYRSISAEAVAAAMIALDLAEFAGITIVESDQIPALARKLAGNT